MTEVFVGSRVVLMDGRAGMVYTIEKPEETPEDAATWTYLVDVDGESVNCSLVYLLEIAGEDTWEREKDMAELGEILIRQADRINRDLTRDKERLLRIRKIQFLLSDAL